METAVADIAGLIKVVRPWGLLSLIKQKIYFWLGKNPFSEMQVFALSEITFKITEFLLWFQHNKPAQEQAETATHVARSAD